MKLKTIPVVHKGKNMAEMELYFVTSDKIPSYAECVKQFPNFALTVTEVANIARNHDWKKKRDEYFAEMYDVLKQKAMVKAIKVRNVVADMSMSLASKAYDKLLEDLKDKHAMITVKDFTSLANCATKAVSAGEPEGLPTVDNSKNITIVFNKKPEDMNEHELEMAIQEIECVEVK